MKLGISSCLLGEECRYDGGHKRYRFITDELSKYFDFKLFCPEHLVFGTPREPIRLVKENEQIKVKRVKTKEDVTKSLENISKQLTQSIEDEELCGFILKAKSPTCGLERIKVYEEDMPSKSDGVGLFAKELAQKFTHLPIEEEGRLEDAWLRENFLMQVFAYRDLHQFLSLRVEFKDLVDFHTSYKYLIYSKSHESYKKLGQIVANHNKKPLSDVLCDYKELFLKSIALKGTRAKTYNILLHMYGYFKNEISKEEKDEILESFNEFKSGFIPLIAAMKLIKINSKRFEIEYILKQKFLNPYPKELALRSSIKAYK